MFPNTNHARLTIMVKSKIDFERVIALENCINPSIVLKIKTSKNKCHYVIGNYRQWKGTSPVCNYNTRKDEDCIARFNDMVKIWTNVAKLGNPTFIAG